VKPPAVPSVVGSLAYRGLAVAAGLVLVAAFARFSESAAAFAAVQTAIIMASTVDSLADGGLALASSRPARGVALPTYLSTRLMLLAVVWIPSSFYILRYEALAPLVVPTLLFSASLTVRSHAVAAIRSVELNVLTEIRFLSVVRMIETAAAVVVLVLTGRALWGYIAMVAVSATGAAVTLRLANRIADEKIAAVRRPSVMLWVSAIRSQGPAFLTGFSVKTAGLAVGAIAVTDSGTAAVSLAAIRLTDSAYSLAVLLWVVPPFLRSLGATTRRYALITALGAGTGLAAFVASVVLLEDVSLGLAEALAGATGLLVSSAIWFWGANASHLAASSRVRARAAVTSLLLPASIVVVSTYA
jgi:hypothetical protein